MWVLAKVITGFVEQKGSSLHCHIPLFHSATCWVRVERAELCFSDPQIIHEFTERRNVFTLSSIHRTLRNSALCDGKFMKKGTALLIFAAVLAIHSPVVFPLKCPNRK